MGNCAILNLYTLKLREHGSSINTVIVSAITRSIDLFKCMGGSKEKQDDMVVITGRYKQWNGLLEWNTGLDYWTELFFFFGQILCLF